VRRRAKLAETEYARFRVYLIRHDVALLKPSFAALLRVGENALDLRINGGKAISANVIELKSGAFKRL
jgi:hypothetical protein